MQVTDVRFRMWNKGTVLAFADVEFDGAFTSKGWRIFEGRDGRELDLGFPSEQDRTGKKDEKTGQTKYWPTIWIDLKTDEGRKLMDHIKDEVFTKYKQSSSKDDKPTTGAKKAGPPQAGDFNDDDIPF